MRPETWAGLAKTNAHAENCVRWDPRRRVYELVVGGEVRASASRLKLSVRLERLKFFAQCEAALEEVRRGNEAERLRVERG